MIWFVVFLIVLVAILLFATFGGKDVSNSVYRVGASTSQSNSTTATTNASSGTYIVTPDGRMYPVDAKSGDINKFCRDECGAGLFGKAARCRRQCKDTLKK